MSTFYETETWEDPLRYYVPPQQDTSGDLTDDEAWWAITNGLSTAFYSLIIWKLNAESQLIWNGAG